MRPRERKERRSRKRKRPEERATPVIKKPCLQCRSSFYAVALDHVWKEVIKYVPHELSDLVCGYYLNLNHSPIKELQRLANLGDQTNPMVIDAMARLGYAYYWGRLVTKNKEEGEKWLQLARRREDLPSGQLALGVCHERGIDMEKSYEAAVSCYKKAASQGYAPAQYELGECYYYGLGVPEDLKEGIGLHWLSSNQGYAEAQNRLGLCYETGRGVSKDLKRAIRLYRLSSDQGNAKGQYNLGYCYEQGTGVERSIEEAIRLYSLSSSQGNAEAQRALKRLVAEQEQRGEQEQCETMNI